MVWVGGEAVPAVVVGVVFEQVGAVGLEVASAEVNCEEVVECRRERGGVGGEECWEGLVDDGVDERGPGELGEDGRGGEDVPG